MIVSSQYLTEDSGKTQRALPALGLFSDVLAEDLPILQVSLFLSSYPRTYTAPVMLLHDREYMVFLLFKFTEFM
jgi:hypothetical protein